ncbi:MAG: hypothetical protein QOJ20_912 [Mycobacterium sp.]|jgi:hypothetical protein|nr:hypothetical protein [Mycobacterium sp.]
MIPAIPVRVTAVFAGLVVATCVTWWLGSGGSHGQRSASVAVTLTVVIAFSKIYFVGADFMELRVAPRALRAGFAAWVAVVSVAAILLVVL